MFMWQPRILFQLFVGANAALAVSTGWHFVQNGTSGVLALEAMVISPTLAVFFDRATNDPLQVDGHTAWGAIWDFETNTAQPLDLVSDTFCASGGFLSNGTMLSVGGHIPVISQAVDGRMAVRILEPCTDPTGATCKIIDHPDVLHLAETRWYPSSLRIFDGSLMIVGGIHERTPFFNTDPVNSFEFFPSKDGDVPRNSSFLARTVPANLFPRVFALPDGKVFMVANNQSIIYDIEAKTETHLPDVPNGVRVTNPYDGTATLLPLSPPDYIPEVLVCGGTNSSDSLDAKLSSQDPASDQCSRITLTPEGIKKGWVLEKMLERRMMPEMILMPNGQVLIINGAGTGYAALAGDIVADPIGGGNADHPVFTPSLYTPNARLGQRFSNAEMPTTNIARLYHSTASLTPMGNVMLAGSNPNNMVVNDTVFATEFRVEYLNPPFMSVARPKLSGVPAKVAFNRPFVVNVTIPANLRATSIKVSLMDLGFSSHAFHSSSRLVFLNAQLAPNRRTLTIESPPNNRIYPPGPGFLFLTIDDVTSPGEMLIIGTGAPPPVPDQGIRL